MLKLLTLLCAMSTPHATEPEPFVPGYTCKRGDAQCRKDRQDQLEIIIRLCEDDVDCWNAFEPQPYPTGGPHRYLFEKRIN